MAVLENSVTFRKPASGDEWVNAHNTPVCFAVPNGDQITLRTRIKAAGGGMTFVDIDVNYKDFPILLQQIQEATNKRQDTANREIEELNKKLDRAIDKIADLEVERICS